MKSQMNLCMMLMIIVGVGFNSLSFVLSDHYLLENQKNECCDQQLTDLINSNNTLAAFLENWSYSTFFGGTGYDDGTDMVFDADGNVIISGTTTSNNFPTTENVFQENKSGGADVFVAKFSADGQTLLFSSFLGGADEDWGRGMVVDTNGSIVVAGATSSSDFYVKNPYQESLAGGYDLFICKFTIEPISTGGASLPGYGLLFVTFGLVVLVILVTRRKSLR